MKNSEVQLVKYRPNLKYTSPILTNVNPDVEFSPSPTLERLMNKTPSGILGELDNTIEEMEVILERLKRCETEKDVNEYIKAIQSNGTKAKDIEKANAFDITGTTQFECIPLLLDSIEECRKIKYMIKSSIYKDSTNSSLKYYEHRDQTYIDFITKKELNKTMTMSELTTAESIAVMVDCASKMLSNTKSFVKGLISVLNNTLNEVYNGNIANIVQTYGSASLSVLTSLNDINKIQFKKACIECENDKIRYNFSTIIVYIIGIILLMQLFNLQIIHGAEYRETSNTRLTRESVLEADRGKISDSSGTVLAGVKYQY